MDQLRARIGEIDGDLRRLDKDFKAGSVEYVEKKQSLKQSKNSLREELHRMGVVT